MGLIISKVGKIDNLYFHKLPTSKIVKIDKAVRFGGDYVFIDENGKLYSNRIGDFAYSPGQWPWIDNVLKALVKLQIITKEEMKEHLGLCQKNEATRQKKLALNSLKRIEKEHGIKFTKAQLGKLKV